MAVKVYVLLAMLMFAGIVSPIAHAQLGGLIGGLLTSFSVTGIVPCNVGNSLNSSTFNVFPNATVQFRCGSTIIATTTTNSTGGFQIVTGSLLTNLVDLLRKCNILVTTPLVTCNASLPTDGNLASPLTTVGPILGVVSLVAENLICNWTGTYWLKLLQSTYIYIINVNPCLIKSKKPQRLAK
ncbi:hypothetical protein LUZ61_003560 [Rhynchospora tenuis]|uniref:Phylloplanin-like n=1 Tax=Rhynchospora tenuis TaxID=198213 RepID=A0AAD5ZL60_9POAL|nr:hypothetical protein LUZ61_003560 [Rhynchospora tenuis]